MFFSDDAMLGHAALWLTFITQQILGPFHTLIVLDVPVALVIVKRCSH